MSNIELSKYFDTKKEIFKDATVFDNSHCPKKPVERKEIPEIMRKVADFMRLGVAENIFIAGKHGNGKTLYGKYLLEQIKAVAEQKNEKIRVEYKNCRDFRDEFLLLMNLCGLEGKEIRSTNFHEEFCTKLKENFVLILDEIDMLQDGDDLLYFFSRITETQTLTKNRVQLILISNKLDWDKDLDNATRSSLNLTKIIFNEYNKSQIKEILQQRLKAGLNHDNTIPDKLINAIVEKTSENNSDLRVSIKALFLLCKEIERFGIKEVSENDLGKIYEKADREVQLERIANLEDVKLHILYAVAKAKDTTVRNIYETEYKEICRDAHARMLGYTRFTFYLKSLQDQNMIIITKDKKNKALYNKATTRISKDVLEAENENRKILSTKYNI